MSINKLLFEEEKRNEFVKESGSTLKQVIGIGGLAAIFGSALSKSSQKKHSRSKSGKASTKLGEAGIALKSSVDDAFTKRTTRDLASANAFFDDLIETSSSILKRTVQGSLEDTPEITAERKLMQKALINEKTYLLTAVRDAVRDLNITGEAGTTRMLVERIEDILDGEMRNVDSLSEEVENVLRSIRNNSTNDKKVQQFKKFKALKENSRYFSGKPKALGVAEKMVGTNRREFATLNQAFKGSFAISKGMDISSDLDNIEISQKRSGYFKHLENEFQTFNRQLQEIGGTVSKFTVVKEHERELGSIYMHVAGRDNKEINYKFGLHFSGVEGPGGSRVRKVVRGTSTLNTPFVIPSFMPHIKDVQNLLTNEASKEDFTALMKKSTPERFVRNMFLNFVERSGGLIDDLSSRQINKFGDMVRAQAISINRASLFSGTENPLGDRLSKNLAVQQTMSSFQSIIYGAESLSQKEAQMIPIKLMQKFGGLVDPPAASQAPLRKATLPNVGEVRGINFNLLELGGEATITPFTALRGFGFKDRGTSPLTAREGQFFGREDFISNLIAPGEKRGAEGSRGFFGRKKMNIIASNSKLLSVDPNIARRLEEAPMGKLGHIQGVNMAGIMFFGEGQAMRAGLGEGMAYYGGSVEVDIPIQKSVLDPEMMKQPEFAFLRELIEKRKAGVTKISEFKLKGDRLTQAFKTYGDERGQIPLGMIDNRVSAIKNLQGLQEVILQIDPTEGVLDDKGRMKYALSGKMRLRSDTNKLFGIMGRVTSYGDPITKQAAIDILGQSFGDKYGNKAQAIAKSIFETYESGFGGKMRNLMMTSSSSGLDKSVDFIQNFMYGGYRMLGGTDRALLDSGLLAREDLMKVKFNLESGVSAKSEKHIARAKLLNFTQSLIRGLESSGQQISTAELGLLISPIKHLEGSSKFGLVQGDLEENILKTLNVGYDQKELKTILSTGLAIGATSMFSGSPAEILGRNMARFEPRHANILMYGMRSFFGLNTEQSVKYLNDFILRQEGIEYSGKYLPDIVSLGMSFKSKMRRSIDGKGMNVITPEIFEKLYESARTITKADPTKADQFRQDLVRLLDRESPSVLNISDVVKGKDNLNKLSKIIPSGQIIIPSGETIEGMVNYQIQKGDRVENIDARMIANLKGVFEHLSELDYDPRAAARLNALNTIKDDILDMTSTALRRSLSGRVTGSVTMQGSGVVISDDMKSSYLSGVDLQQVRKVINKEKGFTVFTNVSGFMDSLNTFMGAATKTKARSEEDALTKTIGKYKDFMFGHLSGRDAVRGVLFRNPSMSISHVLPGIALSRMDVSNVQDISKTLDKNNIGFLNSILQEMGDVSGLKEVMKDTSVKGGVRTFDRISPESVYRLEQALGSQPELATKLGSAQAGVHFKNFQDNINKFYGNNVPLGLKTFSATESGIESAIKTLQGTDYRSNKYLSEAMGSLKGMRSSITKPGKVAKGGFNNIYKNIIENYGKNFGVGGGTMMFPTFTADITLSGREKALSTRLDFSYSMIGDFDADIYQFFHETKGISAKALAEKGDMIRSNIIEASAKFSIIRNLTDEAYNALGRSLGSDEMALKAFKADQAKKEIILKNVGGVDVQFKSMLLGMIENSLSATPDEKGVLAQAAQMAEHIVDNYHAKLASGSTQDIGVLKAKKLPFAVELGEILGGAMRRGLETGNAEDFISSYRQLVLNNSEDLTRGFDISDVKLQGVTPELEDFYRQTLKGKRIAPGEQMLAAMAAGIETAHRDQLYHMGSETKLTKALNQFGTRNKGLFEAGVAGRMGLELGLMGEGVNLKEGASTLDKMETVLDNLTEKMSNTRSQMMRGISGKGMAGLIGFGMVSSYALGASYSSTALSGPDKFSDMKVKEQIGRRAIHNSMSYQHKDISASSMRLQENFYQRPITSKEMYVNKPSSVAISGNASSINDAQKVLQRVTSMGGRGHLSIQDNVLPRPNLADYYMRDK